MTLDEELKFVEAYSYLFKIRYADKLFFDIEIDRRSIRRGGFRRSRCSR